MLRNPLLFLCLLILASGCGVRPGTSGRSNKNFETFFAGSGAGTQYFVKPLTFYGPGKQSASVDLTLRDQDFAEGTTTINYSLATEQQLPEKYAIAVIDANGDEVFRTASVERLFQERTRTGFLARYSGKAPNPRVADAFRSGIFLLRTTLPDGRQLSFAPNAKSQTAIKDLYRDLFSLYEQ